MTKNNNFCPGDIVQYPDWNLNYRVLACNACGEVFAVVDGHHPNSRNPAATYHQIPARKLLLVKKFQPQGEQHEN